MMNLEGRCICCSDYNCHILYNMCMYVRTKFVHTMTILGLIKEWICYFSGTLLHIHQINIFIPTC